jgi:VWFA-related protein
MKPLRLVVVGLLVCAPFAYAFAQARAQQRQPSDDSTAVAVLVDVVVRDKHGKPVTDLQAEDFEIKEDNVAQTLGSFTRVSRGAGIGVNIGLREPGTTLVTPPGTPDEGDAASTQAQKDTTPAVTALVFDALSADGVAMCQKAATHYLPLSGTMGARVGVFITEPVVRALQTYTDDPILLRHAVERVQPTSTLSREEQQERIDALRERRTQLDALQATTESVQAGGPGGLGTSGSIGQLEMERRLVRSQLQMVQAFDSLDRDHRGYGTTGALYAVVQSLVEMPGRKTVVFFSEGLPASPTLHTQLQSLIEMANRFNVTVYAVDANGLRAVSGTQDVRKEVEDAGHLRMRQLSMNADTVDEPLTRIVERTEDRLRLDSQSGLARLSEETGGFLFRDTNDLSQAFQRIDEDIRFHYLLTYAPTNQAFDGTFRTIAVKVSRPGVDVYARKGYRALRMAPTAPVLDYEAAGLAALDKPRVPHDFAFTTGVFSFPEPNRPGLSPLVVRLTTDTLTYAREAASNSYTGEVDIIVRFKNSKGDVVEKVSQQYHLTGHLSELEGAKHGEILFYRQPDLPPGVYTVEALVYDTVGTRASARVSTLEIPKPSPDRARLSSLVLVRKVEHVKNEARQPDNPLYVGDVLLYPNTGEPFSRAADRELTFYYAAWPRKSSTQPPTAHLELRRNGQVLANIPVALGSADGNGRIQQLSRLPLRPLSEGTYELAIVLDDAGQPVERSTFFTVNP